MSPVGPVTATVSFRDRRAGAARALRHQPRLASSRLAVRLNRRALAALARSISSRELRQPRTRRPACAGTSTQPSSAEHRSPRTWKFCCQVNSSLCTCAVRHASPGWSGIPDGRALDPDPARRGVDCNRDPDREREPVGAHDRQDGGRVRGAELLEARRPTLLAPPFGSAWKRSCSSECPERTSSMCASNSSRLGADVAARPHVDTLRPHVDVDPGEVPGQEALDPFGRHQLRDRGELHRRLARVPGAVGLEIAVVDVRRALHQHHRRVAAGRFRSGPRTAARRAGWRVRRWPSSDSRVRSSRRRTGRPACSTASPAR